MVRGTDRIPGYRLSAGSALPGRPTLRALWRPSLGPVLAAVDELVVDLRSGAYAALAPVPGAVTLDVLSERPDGTRAVVSHSNKTHKGRVARLLATTAAEPADAVRLRALLRRAGFHVEHAGGTALTLVVPATTATARVGTHGRAEGDLRQDRCAQPRCRGITLGTRGPEERG